MNVAVNRAIVWPWSDSHRFDHRETGHRGSGRRGFPQPKSGYRVPHGSGCQEWSISLATSGSCLTLDSVVVWLLIRPYSSLRSGYGMGDFGLSDVNLVDVGIVDLTDKDLVDVSRMDQAAS